MYGEVTASNLVKIDLAGNIVEDSGYPINAAGFLIHGAIHEQAPDAHCVIHLHTDAGSPSPASARGCSTPRSSPCSCRAASPITTTRDWRWMPTRSQGWWPTSEIGRASCRERVCQYV